MNISMLTLFIRKNYLKQVNPSERRRRSEGFYCSAIKPVSYTHLDVYKRQEGRVYLHVHAAFADEYGELRGGHLKEAVVSATCEVFITRFDMDLDRRFDPETGLNILNLERSRKHD